MGRSDDRHRSPGGALRRTAPGTPCANAIHVAHDAVGRGWIEAWRPCDRWRLSPLLVSGVSRHTTGQRMTRTISHASPDAVARGSGVNTAADLCVPERRHHYCQCLLHPALLRPSRLEGFPHDAQRVIWSSSKAGDALPVLRQTRLALAATGLASATRWPFHPLAWRLPASRPGGSSRAPRSPIRAEIHAADLMPVP
jgi:hypothetical protein